MYSYTMEESYRNRAIALLKGIKGHRKLEERAWNHSSKQYPLIIRRLCAGMSFEEATAILEPIEKKEQKEEMVDGDITCPKCKSKKVHRIEKQTRSADESATVFCYCSECGKRWKF